MERAKGIEPSTLVWKTKVIPFYDTRTGIPQETRTLTNGFGDRRAAITLGRNIWTARENSNP